MKRQRHAEIGGAGFAGLTAAIALRQRGWSVRVHERSPEIRAHGSAIYLSENGLRVLESLGAYEAATLGAFSLRWRETRNEDDWASWLGGCAQRVRERDPTIRNQEKNGAPARTFPVRAARARRASA